MILQKNCSLTDAADFCISLATTLQLKNMAINIKSMITKHEFEMLEKFSPSNQGQAKVFLCIYMIHFFLLFSKCHWLSICLIFFNEKKHSVCLALLTA